VAELQATLAALIPHIISVVYNPRGSANELAATARDIRDKQRLLAKKARESRLSIFKLKSRVGGPHSSTKAQHAPAHAARIDESCSAEHLHDDEHDVQHLVTEASWKTSSSAAPLPPLDHPPPPEALPPPEEAT
jgi:hypothetical protein